MTHHDGRAAHSLCSLRDRVVDTASQVVIRSLKLLPR
jgi:hypothetical protein